MADGTGRATVDVATVSRLSKLRISAAIIVTIIYEATGAEAISYVGFAAHGCRRR